MTDKIADVSDEAVASATGHDWAGWLAVLDEAAATEMDHKEIVATLAAAGVDSGWWQQKIAVGYEQERGLREPGETQDADYQIGVQRTLPIGQDALWELLTSPDGRRLWLGGEADLAFEPGEVYETSASTTGEIRTIKPGERLRLTWQPADMDVATTLQVTLECPRNDADKTVLRFHHEKLPDGETREAMRAHWQAVADAIEARVADSDG